MKKLIFSLSLALVSFGAFGQDALFQDFLNVRALQVGTNSVGYFGLTNLANLTTNMGAIYSSTNLAYTNLNGTYIHPGLAAVIAAYGATNQYTTPTIYKDVSLWADRDGNAPWRYIPTDVANGQLTNAAIYSGATLFIELVAGPWLTNGAIGLQFRPIWDGVSPNNYTADDWWVVIPTSTGLQRPKQHLTTNAPLWRWSGAEKLRLVNITNNNTTITGGATTVTNAAFLTKVRLTGFRP